MRIVKIEWVDSYGVTGDWLPTSEAKDVKHVCVSVGFIVVDGAHSIVLASNLSPKNDKIDAEEMTCGNMAIPTKAILSIVELMEDPDSGLEM